MKIYSACSHACVFTKVLSKHANFVELQMSLFRLCYKMISQIDMNLPPRHLICRCRCCWHCRWKRNHLFRPRSKLSGELRFCQSDYARTSVSRSLILVLVRRDSKKNKVRGGTNGTMGVCNTLHLAVHPVSIMNLFRSYFSRRRKLDRFDFFLFWYILYVSYILIVRTVHVLHVPAQSLVRAIYSQPKQDQNWNR